MVDNNSTPLGDLLLLKHKEDHFSELEIQLVQHLADQCAIAIRQARLYKAVQSQVSDLEQLNYLKDDFLSTVSHELRSPMSNIKMATQMLETLLFPADCSLSQPTSTASSPIFSPSSFQKASRYFKILKDECQREIELINDLLDLSRLEAGVQPLNLSTIELHDWLLPIVEPFIERARSQHQTLTYTIAQPLPSITTDLISLERILTELLTNACKYTPYGHHIALDVWTEAPTLYLQVSNSGIGLPEAELNRIFDKFYRVPNHDPWKYGGTGLGLALVQKLLEQLSGQVTVTSEHNLITFLVKIPITLAI
jgi:signal transduction histidine kinase